MLVDVPNGSNIHLSTITGGKDAEGREGVVWSWVVRGGVEQVEESGVRSEAVGVEVFMAIRRESKPLRWRFFVTDPVSCLVVVVVVVTGSSTTRPDRPTRVE